MIYLKLPDRILLKGRLDCARILTTQLVHTIYRDEAGIWHSGHIHGIDGRRHADGEWVVRIRIFMDPFVTNIGACLKSGTQVIRLFNHLTEIEFFRLLGIPIGDWQ